MNSNIQAPSIDIGISMEDRQLIANGLNKLLADSYTLYLMTHNFHWNVTGLKFNDLHNMFMGQYTEMWTALDEIAERIRSLDFAAPGTYKAFSQLSSIEEVEGVPAANEMVQLLTKGHEAVAKTARAVLPLAEQANDEVTADLITQRLTVHEKTAWMLRSILR